jgi:hypothetical protein
MGQPIEDAARKATAEEEHHIEDPIKHYANELERQLAEGADVQDPPPPTSTLLLTLAQQKFIAAQMAFIHDQKNLVLMFNAQRDYLIDLIQFMGEAHLPTILTIQENFIHELHDRISKQNGLG